MLFRLQTSDTSLVVKRSTADRPIAPVAVAVSLAVCVIGAYGLRQAGHSAALIVTLAVLSFSGATLLFVLEDRRRQRAYAKEGSIFDRQAGRFVQDGQDICALEDLDRVRLLQTADCNGGIYELAVVTKAQAAFELVGAYAATGEEKTELERLGHSVAEYCRLSLVHEVEQEVDTRQGGR